MRADRTLPSRLLALLLMVVLAPLLAPRSWGQDLPEAPSVPALPGTEEEAPPPAPAVRVVGFRDGSGSGDCDPVLARFGQCIEEVQFVDLRPAWNKSAQQVRASWYQDAQWRNTAHLYAQLWEDLAYRWSRDGDVLEDTLKKAGIAVLPPPAEEWEASRRNHNRIFSLPDPALWLDQDDWVQPKGPRGSSVQSFYRRVRYHAPLGQGATPPMVLMAGRFALRLGYAGRRHDYDLMDGNPKSSGPFFEQMYPYTRGLQASEASLAPLLAFRVTDFSSEAAQSPEVEALRFDGGLRALERLARQQFADFAQLLGVQIVQYGMEEYTANHMRVLTALTAMRSPPLPPEQVQGRRGDLVAAARGETDTEEEVKAHMGNAAYSLQREFEINFLQLPLDLVRRYLKEILRYHQPSREYFQRLQDVLFQDLESALVPSPSPLKGLAPEQVEAWAKENQASPALHDRVVERVQRIALQVLVTEELPKPERDDYVTRILLDHVKLEVSSTFDATPGARLSPNELVAGASLQWRNVLSKHGYTTRPISQGLGAVDPTAICTTRDGVAALDEPVFGAINLDLLFVNRDGQASDPVSVQKLLWSERDILPFLAVDNPDATRPQVERLVGLPDGRALYRARWRIWTGWHMFWTSVYEPSTGRRRLVLRTGAICDDMVLAPPDLVPTLVRAALLDGNFRPTTPIYERDQRRKEARSSDEQVAQASSALQQGQDTSYNVQTGVTVSEEEGPETAVSQGLSVGQKLVGLFKSKKVELEEIPTEVTSYIRSLVWPKLSAIAQEEGPLLVVVFDSTDPSPRHALKERRPRVPYARRQERIRKVHPEGGKYVRTAAWIQYFPPEPDKPVRQLSPAYAPTESVSTQTLTPRWRRLKTSDWHLLVGLGGFPIRYTVSTCNDDPDVDIPSTVACTEHPNYGEGFSGDLAALFTWWVVDDFRTAVEFGPEVRLDTGHGGPSWFWQEQDPTVNAWTFRPQFGLVAGVRRAPDPYPLARRSKLTLPWGAENPDGSAHLGRFQYGLRGGFLTGPGYNGLEATAMLELWSAWSLRRARSPQANFTPYHPGFLLGPFVRGQYEWVFSADEVRLKTLDHSLTAIVGLRANIRLGNGDVSLPEGGS